LSSSRFLPEAIPDFSSFPIVSNFLSAGRIDMALLLKAEDIKGLISIEEAIEAVESGFRDQAKHPQFSLPRHRMMAGDRRINIHSGGCVDLGIAGTFIHYERHRYTKEDQTYAAAGKRVYLAYDGETAALLTIIVGSIPLYAFDDNDICYRDSDHQRGRNKTFGTRRLPGFGSLRHGASGAAASKSHLHTPPDPEGQGVQSKPTEPQSVLCAHASSCECRNYSG
jgi:hypothetical protein